MTTATVEGSATTVLDSIRGTKDALSVRRVFGEPYDVGGVSVIPVARIAGGAGGGGGEGPAGTEPGSTATGSGFGTGFGMSAHPVGVYEVRDGELAWKPAIDATRLARGGQVLAAIVAICVTLVMLRRSTRRHS